MSKIHQIALPLLVIFAVFAQSAPGEDSLGSMFKEKGELEKQVAAVNKDYEPKIKPLQEQLSALRKEIREKTKTQQDRSQKLNKQITEAFKKLLPSGKQSYGEFAWDCRGGPWLNVTAKNKAGKQMVWIQVFYRPDMTPEKQKKYGSKTCCGLPAKRFKNKWVWVQAGKIEMRFGLSDPSLESDAILDAIVGSFKLDAIKGS